MLKWSPVEAAPPNQSAALSLQMPPETLQQMSASVVSAIASARLPKAASSEVVPGSPLFDQSLEARNNRCSGGHYKPG